LVRTLGRILVTIAFRIICLLDIVISSYYIDSLVIGYSFYSCMVKALSEGGILVSTVDF